MEEEAGVIESIHKKTPPIESMIFLAVNSSSFLTFYAILYKNFPRTFNTTYQK